jgi:hypothetical protein
MVHKEVTIYTVLIGNYDTLEKPIIQNYRFVCFSDIQREIAGWEVITFEQSELTNTRNSRKPKMLSNVFIDTPYSIYHDANRSLSIEPHILIDNYLSNCDIAFFKHPHRKCLYAEEKAVIETGKDISANTTEQITRYHNDGFPANYGLHAGGIMVRRMTLEVMKFENVWWTEYKSGSHRDQLSLDYSRWKTGIEFSEISGDYFDNELFEYRRHNE